MKLPTREWHVCNYLVCIRLGTFTACRFVFLRLECNFHVVHGNSINFFAVPATREERLHQHCHWCWDPIDPRRTKWLRWLRKYANSVFFCARKEAHLVLVATRCGRHRHWLTVLMLYYYNFFLHSDVFCSLLTYCCVTLLRIQVHRSTDLEVLLARRLLPRTTKSKWGDEKTSPQCCLVRVW